MASPKCQTRLMLRQWCIQAVLYAVHAAEDMISDFLGAEESPEDAAGQQAAAGMLLQILQKSASMHTEVPKQSAIPLGIAILDPLCQLITSMLGLMHSQPAAAQVNSAILKVSSYMMRQAIYSCSPLRTPSPGRQMPAYFDHSEHCSTHYRVQHPHADFMVMHFVKCSAHCCTGT